MSKKNAYHITILDVNKIIPFQEKIDIDLMDKVSNHQDFEEKLEIFLKELKNNIKNNIFPINSDLLDDSTHIEEYLVENIGYMKIIVTQPVTINCYFTDLSKAKKFKKAIQKTFEKILEDNMESKIFLSGIEIEKIKEEDGISISQFKKIQQLFFKNSVINTIIAVIIVFFFEIIKAGFEVISLLYLEISSSSVTIIGAVFIAFLFEPAKKKVDNLVSRYIN